MSETARSLVTLAGILFAALNIAAVMIWVERRGLALWQERYGPNRVGPFGVLQPAADALKLFFKEDWTPPFADRPVFILAPAIAMVAILSGFAVIPVAPGWVVAELDVGLLFFLAMSSMAAYSVVLGGWASNNKYSLLGGLRSAAQMLTYEVFMGLSLMGVVVQAGTFDLTGIVAAQEGLWFCVPQAVGLAVFLVAGLAETHRLPFDLPEAESELVAGYHSEYSGMKFGMFFVGEYVGMTLVSALIATLFFGGWRGPWIPQPIGGPLWLLLKTGGFLLFFVFVRAALPRPRYDQLMSYGWKVLLPLSILNLMITGAMVLWRG